MMDLDHGLDDFPWEDPDDTGFVVEPFDPEKDMAPEGAADDCTGEGE